MTLFNFAMVLVGFCLGCMFMFTVCAFAWMPSRKEIAQLKALRVTQQQEINRLKTVSAIAIKKFSDGWEDRLPPLSKGKPNA